MLVGRQAETRAGGIDELRATFAVALGRAGDFRDALADGGLGDDDFRAAVGLRFCFFQCGGDGLEVVAVDGDRIPILREEVGLGVFALGEVRHSVECHIVGIIDQDQVVEAIVAGKRDGFLGDTFLEAAVAVQGDDVVVDDRVIGRVEAGGSTFSGERVSDGIADSLAERAGGGLHARGFMKLRVAGSDRVQLAEIFHIVPGNRVSREVQPAVEEHRTVAGGENEAVTVQPFRRIRAIAH